MGFEPTTLRDLAGRSEHEATGDLNMGLSLEPHRMVVQLNDELFCT